MCRIDDAEWATTLTDVTRTARKDHPRACTECGRSIRAGERYHYNVAVSDFGMDTRKQCAHCDAAATWLDVACGGWLWGGIAEELREHRDDEPQLRSDVLDGLIAGIARQWDDGAAPVPAEEAIRASVPREAWSPRYVRYEQMRAEAAGQQALL